MPANSPALSQAQIDSFIADGFVRLDHAFPTEIADQCRAILWPLTGSDPDDRSTWTKPVVRIGHRADPPFVASINTPILHAAFDQLVGKGRWAPRNTVGTIPIRFPSARRPATTAGTSTSAMAGGNGPPTSCRGGPTSSARTARC